MVIGLEERSNGEARAGKGKAISEQGGNGRDKRKVKTRTLEIHKDAAPTFVPTVNVSATRQALCALLPSPRIKG
jgi:hypothetical protein